MITIFTATYNRKATLSRLYESLLSQTNHDFEWLIVDDGSTDGTEELIKSFHNTLFNVIYKKNNHLGKHVAVNTGLDLCNGDLFFLVDSDDYLPVNSLEIVYHYYNDIIAEKDICGISGRMVNQDGRLIGKKQKKNYCTGLCKEIKHNGIFDRGDILKTSIFKHFKYPVFESEWHIAPGVPFIRMSNAGYKVLFIKDVIYIAEYLPGGLTSSKNKKLIENFNGYTLRCRELLASDVGFLLKIKVKIKYSFLAKSEMKLSNVNIAGNILVRKQLVPFYIFVGKLLNKLKFL